MSETTVFFEDKERVAKEEALKLRVFMLFSLIIGVSTLYYGLVQFSLPEQKVERMILSIVGFLLLLNGFLYPLHKRLKPAKYALSVLIMIGIISALSSGGVAGTTVFWVIAFPTTTFLFQGLKGGVLMAEIFIPMLLFQNILQWTGIIPTYYSPVQHREMWTVIVIVTILGYIAERQREKEREESAKQRESLNVLLQSMSAGVLMFEASTGRVVAANAETKELFGKEVMSDMSITDIAKRIGLTMENGEPFPSEELPAAKALKGEQLGRSDIFVKKEDGHTHVLRMSGSPIRDVNGEVVSAIMVIQDATKEHEIDQMKSEFVSLASHQLKTPLAGISWGLETILSDEKGKLSVEQKVTIDEVGTIVGRLSRLVSDLLNVSRIETGRKFNIVKKLTDMTALVASVVKESMSSAEKRKILLVDMMPESLVLEVDSEKCREVLMNLIGNAIKYTKDGGRVEVGTTRTQKDVILYVQDDGVGIPKHQQKRIFEKFFRAENVAEEIEGTGLGLYIARVIIQKHGGRMWFSTEEGKGTTFYAAFPIKAAATEEKTAS